MGQTYWVDEKHLPGGRAFGTLVPRFALVLRGTPVAEAAQMRGVVAVVVVVVVAHDVVPQESVAGFGQIQIGHVGQARLGVSVPFVSVPPRRQTLLRRGHRGIGGTGGDGGTGGTGGTGGAVGVVVVDRGPVPFAQVFVVAGRTQASGGVQAFVKHLFPHLDGVFPVGGVGGVKDTPVAKPRPDTGQNPRDVVRVGEAARKEAGQPLVHSKCTVSAQ